MRALIRMVCLALVLATAGQVQAGFVTTYSDRMTFNSAVVGSLTVEDFGPIARYPISTGVLNTFTNLPGIGINPGFIKPGVTYSTPVATGNFFNIDFGADYVGGFLDGLSTGNPLTIDFDSPLSAFGFDKSRLLATEFDVTVKFVSGPDQTFTYAHTAMSFFGWISDAADIKSVIVKNKNSSFNFDLDNFTFGGQSTAPVPEPATMALFGLGAAGMSLIVRRKKYRTA